MTEDVLSAMYARKRSNPIGRDGQLRGSLRTCGPALQRQHTHDHLQTIRKPMLELLGKRDVTLQEVDFSRSHTFSRA